MIEEAIIQAKDDLNEDLNAVTAGDQGEMFLKISCQVRLDLNPPKILHPTGKVVNFRKSISPVSTRLD